MNTFQLVIYDWSTRKLIKSFDVKGFHFSDNLLYAYTVEETPKSLGFLNNLVDLSVFLCDPLKWSIVVNLSCCFVEIFYLGDKIYEEE